MDNSSDMPERGGCEKSLRFLMNGLCKMLPDRMQYHFFVKLKQIRNIVVRKRFESLYHSWDHLSNEQCNAEDRTVTATFAITHDVDYVGCHRYLPRLIEINAELGIKATYNFLTHGRYKLADNVLFLIKDGGNEIGLHGKQHDRALGFRSPGYIKEFIASSKRELEKRIGRIHGFRAPALAISRNVLSALEELGFKYDSSLTNSDLYTSFTPRCRPFKIGGSGLVEIPLSIQDSMFVNDIPASQVEIDQLFKHLIGITLHSSATLVVNCHPIIISSNPERYMRLAAALKASSLRQSLMKDTF